ncbi:MAG: hypothetical protein E7537_03490 [Ruminococcaceae bacterium]|nr:hypothetical protein [Oscillospiraceae bacterium]
MIKENYYKDRPAVTLKSEILSATFLHLDGAKLASLKFKDIEFLAQTNGNIEFTLKIGCKEII